MSRRTSGVDFKMCALATCSLNGVQLNRAYQKVRRTSHQSAGGFTEFGLKFRLWIDTALGAHWNPLDSKGLPGLQSPLTSSEVKKNFQFRTFEVEASNLRVSIWDPPNSFQMETPEFSANWESQFESTRLCIGQLEMLRKLENWRSQIGESFSYVFETRICV